MLEALVLLTGLGRLFTLLGLIIFFLLGFPLLVREPTRWQPVFFKALAILAGVTGVLDFVLRRPNWLHASYGFIAALLLIFVSGLEPGGWFRKSLKGPLERSRQQQAERVGQYFFWASFVGFLLWGRFLQTG